MTMAFPAALLLDFGGVIVESTTTEGWEDTVADTILAIAADAGASETFPSRERILADVSAGVTAAKLWRNAMSRPKFPRELTHQEFVMDFLAADWPAAAHEVLAVHTARIAYAVSEASQHRVVRPGMAQLLRWCAGQNLPVAVVSNAQSGQVHRDILAAAGLDQFIQAQIYSDEHRVRKPNPRMIQLGAEAVGADPRDCWYVGDHLDRDVLCGQRAGVAASVLMDVDNLADRPFRPPVEPDLHVAHPTELLEQLQAAVRRATERR